MRQIPSSEPPTPAPIEPHSESGASLPRSLESYPSAADQSLALWTTGTTAALPETEALFGAVTEFLAAITEDRAPATDGHAGLRVLADGNLREAEDLIRGYLRRKPDDIEAMMASRMPAGYKKVAEPNDVARIVLLRGGMWGGTWMGGYGGMGIWLPILVIALIAGLVIWAVVG